MGGKWERLRQSGRKIARDEREKQKHTKIKIKKGKKRKNKNEEQEIANEGGKK